MNYAYIRGSMGTIDKNNQIKSIEAYAKKQGIEVNIIEDTVSSSKAYEKRKISTLIDQASKGDTILCAELSRFARDTEETLMIARLALEKGIQVEILNPYSKLDDSMMTKAALTIMGLANEWERHFIKSRTKIKRQQQKEEYLANEKKYGKNKGYYLSKTGKKIYSMGAPKGKPQRLKLESKKNKIYTLMDKGLSKTAIRQLIADDGKIISKGALERFLERFPYEGQTSLNL